MFDMYSSVNFSITENELTVTLKFDDRGIVDRVLEYQESGVIKMKLDAIQKSVNAILV